MYILLFQVRGVFVIVLVGVLSFVVEILLMLFSFKEEVENFVVEKFQYFIIVRLIVVNIMEVVKYLILFVKGLLLKFSDIESIKIEFIKEIEGMLDKDLSDNKVFGRFGVEYML